MNEPDIGLLLGFLEELDTFTEMVDELDSEDAINEISSSFERIGKQVLTNSEIEADELSHLDVGLLYVISELHEKPFKKETA